MAQGSVYTTLGELLDESGETEQDEQILERVKTLAQEFLPDGWTRWEVVNASKVEVFGEKPEPCVLNKLMFALPTVGLARAFNPEANHLSEKGYREIRHKLLDFAFARALILGPPSIANRIRGSAARTELFKESVEAIRPLLHTRAEANKILSGSLSETEETNRKRRSSSISSGCPTQKRRRMSPVPSTSNDVRFECLEKKMENMFSLLLQKIDSRSQHLYEPDSDKENFYSDSEGHSSSESSGGGSWNAPNMDNLSDMTSDLPLSEIEFRPKIQEVDPLIPEPTEEMKKEGIECQRLGSEGWNRIRYKEVAKRLHAAPVFSALKTNMELISLQHQPSPALIKQDSMLGTISHGLLLQRKALADGLNKIKKKCPEASEDLHQLLADDSQLRILSDDLLQFVCAHRAEVIEARRRAYSLKNDLLGCALHSIPPSPTHIFDEGRLGTFLRENGGLSQVFPVKQQINKHQTFRRPAIPSRPNRGRQQSWRAHPSTFPHNKPARAAVHRTPVNSRPSIRQRSRPGKGKKSPRQKY